jgi:hypothetical protein
MMSPALATQLHHKHRKAILTVQDHIKREGHVTVPALMSAHGWSRSKAMQTLQMMSLLDILQPQKP